MQLQIEIKRLKARLHDAEVCMASSGSCSTLTPCAAAKIYVQKYGLTAEEFHALEVAGINVEDAAA